MSEYSKVASGKVISNRSGAGPVILPFHPQRVEFYNFDAQAVADDNVPFAYWDVSMGQGAAVYQLYVGGVLTTAFTTSGGISTFEKGLLLQFGAKKQISASTKGVTTSFEVTGHGYVNDDVVMFTGLYQTSTSGMPQMSTIPFSVYVVDANNFIVNWNSSGSNYTDLTVAAVGAYVRQVLNPNLYIPSVSFINGIEYGNTTEISTTKPHCLVVGQQVAFHIPDAWGPTGLNSLPNPTIPGSPVYGYVVRVVSPTMVEVNIDSSTFDPFNSNQPVASVPGQNFPQMIAVGNVNTGGFPIYFGSPLYPSPTYLDINSTFSTINGPAIQGAFVNNTSQGFIIGATVAPIGEQSIYWVAYYDDLRV